MNKLLYPILTVGVIAVALILVFMKGKTGPLNDPFTYCASVVNIDSPDSRYVGEKFPATINSGLRKALNVSTDEPDEVFTNGSSWRCMNGEVYGCNVGANLPCTAKANTDKTPTAEENEYCQANPNQAIPAAVTGHDTVYEWNCQGKTPQIGKQIFAVDQRGFISDIWYKIPKN